MARRPQHHDGGPTPGHVSEEPGAPLENLLHLARGNPVQGELGLVFLIEEESPDVDVRRHLQVTLLRYNVL